MKDTQITSKLKKHIINDSLTQPWKVFNTLKDEFKKQSNIDIHWSNHLMPHQYHILGIDKIKGISIRPKNIISGINQIRNYQGTFVYSSDKECINFLHT